MKKLSMLLTLAVSLFTLASCGSIKGINYKEAASVGTPENSVVFYGGFTEGKSFIFAQRDRNFMPDNQSLSNCEDIFVSAPVAPGSSYTVQYLSGSYSAGRIVYIFSEVYPLNWHGFDFQVPKKPGLYYLGYFDGPKSFENGEFEKAKFLLKSDKGAEKDALKVALSVYKGTAWESAIRERIKELD